MRTLFLAIIMIGLTGCTSDRDIDSFDHEILITRLGPQSIEDRNSYRYSERLSFTAVQRYKIKNLTDNSGSQVLFAKVTVWTGDILEQGATSVYIPLENGEYEFQCSSHASIQSNEEDSWGPIRCEFEPISIFFPDVGATLADQSADGPDKQSPENATGRGEANDKNGAD